ncbi:MAG TPA: 4a-hydroxytetrahydrobiopterin dehydratase [Dehalococcoidia bacterium]|nr:4a-hydroxytetrahydrobiopterin dehydratase [Dehalococcoidia bacterium]
MTTLEDLLNGHCFERPKGSPTLTPERVAELLPLVPDWELGADGQSIVMKRRTDGFSAAAMLLVKIAAAADEEDHHPDVRIYGYRWLELTLTTHSIGGLSDNDFILAAKLNRLLQQL